MTGDSPALTGIENPQWAPCGRCRNVAYRCQCRFKRGDRVRMRCVFDGTVTGVDDVGVWVQWDGGAHIREPWPAVGLRRVDDA